MPAEPLLLTIAGRTVIDWALSALQGVPGVTEIVVAPVGEVSKEVGAILHQARNVEIKVAEPEPSRVAAMRSALRLGRPTGRVVIHDPDRPLVSAEGLISLLAASSRSVAAVTAVPVKSTFKSASGGAVLATLPRNRLFHLQSPRIFDRVTLEAILDRCLAEGWAITDELEAARRAGVRLRLLDGDYFNVRIALPADIEFAEMVLTRKLWPLAGN